VLVTSSWANASSSNDVWRSDSNDRLSNHFVMAMARVGAVASRAASSPAADAS
jgi:hypothetical protein